MPFDPTAMPGQAPTPQPNSNITVSSPDHIDEHLMIAEKRLKQIQAKKTMGFKQLDEVRKIIVQDFIGTLMRQGIDVTTPDKMQAYLVQLEQTNPDLAEIILWAFGQLSPSAAQQDHMAGMANPNIQTLSAPPGQSGSTDQMGAPVDQGPSPAPSVPPGQPAEPPQPALPQGPPGVPPVQ